MTAFLRAFFEDAGKKAGMAALKGRSTAGITCEVIRLPQCKARLTNVLTHIVVGTCGFGPTIPTGRYSDLTRMGYRKSTGIRVLLSRKSRHSGIELVLRLSSPLPVMIPMNNPIANPNIAMYPEAVASIHEQGVVILHTGTGRIFGSNLAGACIWRGIELQLSPEAIAERLKSHFPIERTTAREHTARFLEQLQENGLIERRAEA